MDLFKNVVQDLKKQTIPARIIASKFRHWLDENSKESQAATDPYYLPFYYHLGKHYHAKHIFYWQMGIGLLAGSYLMRTQAESVFGIHETTEPYSPSLAKANLRLVHKGKLDLEVCPYTELGRLTEYDLVIVDGRWNYQECFTRLNFIWDHLPSEGLLCLENLVDKTTEQVFIDFSIGKHCDYAMMPTRYKTGLLVKV